MPSGSLGNASLVLSANSAKLSSDLAAAKGTIGGFASQAQGLFASAFSNIGSTITGSISGGIGAVVGTITSAISNAVSGVSGLGKIGKQAGALGIDPSQFMGLQQVLGRVGIGADQTANFFGHLSGSILRAAQTGAGPAARVLEGLGLDAQELANSSADEQLMAIADAFQRLGPGANTAAMAMRLFGTTDILPVLMRGREGINGMIEAGRNSGAVLSNDQIDAAEQAAGAWRKMKTTVSQAFEGLKNSVLVAVAPIIERLANFASDAFTYLQPVFTFLRTSFEVIGEIGKVVWDSISEAVSGFWQWIQTLLPSMDGITSWFGSAREFAITCFRAITVAGAYMWDTLKAGAGFFAMGLSMLVDGVGYLVDGFARVTGQGQAAADAIHRAGQNMRNWGRDQVNGFGDSAAAANRFYDGILARGRQVTRENRSINQQAPNLRQEKPDQNKDTKYENAAIEAGTKEAYSALVQFQMGQYQTQEMQLDRIGNNIQQGNDQLRRIADRLERAGVNIEEL